MLQLTENCPRSIRLGVETYFHCRSGTRGSIATGFGHDAPVALTHDPAPPNVPAVVNVTVCDGAGRAPIAIAAAPTSAARLSICIRSSASVDCSCAGVEKISAFRSRALAYGVPLNGKRVLMFYNCLSVHET